MNYGYEQGAFARIPVSWNEARRTLTIGRREGSFPGMLAQRTFEITLISGTKPVGFSFEPRADKTVRYAGDTITLRLP